MAYLFHQNMRVYGGGNGPKMRNQAYNNPGGGFATVAAGLGVGMAPVAVAGFTEITNNRASRAALMASCAQLGAAFVGNVACGITALARGPEYIGLGRNAAYPLVGVGRILFQIGGGVTLLHQRAATTAALNNLGLPPTSSADYRGLVYAIVTTPAGNIAVGFLHNLYTFQANRVVVAAQIGSMLSRMGAAANGQPAALLVARYMGGDFNVGLISPRGIGNGYSANAPFYPAGAAGMGTTYSGSLYDYWYSDIGAVAPAGLIVPVAAASSVTMDAGPGAGAAGLAQRMSDHTATLLQII